jgi:hypothetical protein
MFPGSGFGVAVTVAELRPSPLPQPVRPGVTETPMRLHEMLPADGLTDAELAREIQAATRVETLVAAYRAERVAQLAARRPATADRQQSEPGSAREVDPLHDVGVSEFFPDELAQIMNSSRTAATRLTETALTLLTRLPHTWEALSSGELDWPRARGLAAELGWSARDTDPELVAEVEAAVLPAALGMSIPALRAAARRELIARDAAAADRRARQAERNADVVTRPTPTAWQS